MALNLFGVTLHDAHAGEIRRDVELVIVRELAAICGESEYREIEPDNATVQRHAEIVAACASHGPVLPAPVGIVFRTTESVQTWLELHYSTLSEAFAFVDHRVAARVHVRAAPDVVDATSDLVAAALEGLRSLRRAAVTSLPIRADRNSGVLSSAAFLIEELNWNNFKEEVEAQATTNAKLLFELTGPWAPYDFVKMQLGA